jgi:hypothetical protein
MISDMDSNGYVSNMDAARNNAEIITLVCQDAPDLLADVLVEETRSKYAPGGYARYMCMAAWREMFAGE